MILICLFKFENHYPDTQSFNIAGFALFFHYIVHDERFAGDKYFYSDTLRDIADRSALLCYKSGRKLFQRSEGGTVEEKRLTEKFNDVFVKTMPIMEKVKKGFFTQKLDILSEGKEEFKDILRSRVDFVQKLIEEKNKSETEKKYVLLLPSFQTIGLAIENLINKMETKVELKILFSEKALNEIKDLFNIMEEQLRDIKDYIATKNPGLKTSIKSCWEQIYEKANEYALIHQNRLIAGVCMPKASYLYLDIIDSIKRISRGLSDFSEQV